MQPIYEMASSRVLSFSRVTVISEILPSGARRGTRLTPSRLLSSTFRNLAKGCEILRLCSHPCSIVQACDASLSIAPAARSTARRVTPSRRTRRSASTTGERYSSSAAAAPPRRARPSAASRAAAMGCEVRASHAEWPRRHGSDRRPRNLLTDVGRRSGPSDSLVIQRPTRVTPPILPWPAWCVTLTSL